MKKDIEAIQSLGRKALLDCFPDYDLRFYVQYDYQSGIFHCKIVDGPPRELAKFYVFFIIKKAIVEYIKEGMDRIIESHARTAIEKFRTIDITSSEYKDFTLEEINQAQEEIVSKASVR